jgi:hypothetical protein
MRTNDEAARRLKQALGTTTNASLRRNLESLRALTDLPASTTARLGETMAKFAQIEEAASKSARLGETMAKFAQMEEAASKSGRLGETLAASLAATDAMSKKVVELQGMDQLLNSISRISVPTRVLDASLIRSGLDTATIHTSAYVPRLPRAKPAPTQAESDQRRLLDAYDSLLKFEFEMRDLITTRLTARVGPRWWKLRIPTDVVEDCEVRKAEKEKPGGTSHHPLYYAYPDDYKKIILRRDNWPECFQPVFRSKTEVEFYFLCVAAARPDIAHARPLDGTVFTKFVTSVRWIINAIDGADESGSQ